MRRHRRRTIERLLPKGQRAIIRSLLFGLSIAMPAICLLVLAAQSRDAAAEPEFADRYAVEIAEASARFGIPAQWLHGLIRVESAGNPRAVSPKGAIGLMQIMPETYAELQLRYGLGADPFDPRNNILAGAAYLREMHDRFGSQGFLAAYNAGPGRFEEHLASGQPLPVETQVYLGRLAPLITDIHGGQHFVAALDARTWARAPLFIVRDESSSGELRHAAGTQTRRLPAGRAAVDLTALIPQSSGLFVRPAEGARTPWQ